MLEVRDSFKSDDGEGVKDVKMEILPSKNTLVFCNRIKRINTGKPTMSLGWNWCSYAAS